MEKIERTLILVKHDGVYRAIVGEIIKRFENIGLKIVGMKMVWANEKIAGDHYIVTDEWANDVFNKAKNAADSASRKFPYKDAKAYASDIQKKNKNFLMEGPVVAIVFEGHHSVELGRKLVGSTEPRAALPGTIRGDFMHDSYKLADGRGRSLRNLMHASGTPQEADREISLWFNESELYDYSKDLDKHHR